MWNSKLRLRYLMRQILQVKAEKNKLLNDNAPNVPCSDVQRPLEFFYLPPPNQSNKVTCTYPKYVVWGFSAVAMHSPNKFVHF